MNEQKEKEAALKEAELQEKLLKKARRAIWLYRYLRISVPAEYEELIVRLECCDEAFMRVYVHDKELSFIAEGLFFDLYLDKDAEMMQDYVICHGASTENQVKVVKSKKLELITDLILHYQFGVGQVSGAAIDALIKLKDVDFLCRVLGNVVQEARNLMLDEVPRVINICCHRIIATKDSSLLIIFLKLCRTLKAGEFVNYERWVFQSGDKDMINAYTENFGVRIETLEAIVTGGIKIPDRREFLKKQIEKNPLNRYILNYLVTQEDSELLKLHYEKHGLTEDVLAHFVHLKQFKKEIGQS